MSLGSEAAGPQSQDKALPQLELSPAPSPGQEPGLLQSLVSIGGGLRVLVPHLESRDEEQVTQTVPSQGLAGNLARNTQIMMAAPISHVQNHEARAVAGRWITFLKT